MRTIKFTRPASVDEHVRLGNSLVSELKNLWALQEEKKQSAKEYGEMVKAKEAYIKVLQDNLESHKISLEVECKVIKSYKESAWLLVDPTSGEIVCVEPFTEGDYQWSLVMDADEVVDENGELREQKLLDAPKVLQLTSGGDYTDYIEDSEQETPAEEVA